MGVVSGRAIDDPDLRALERGIADGAPPPSVPPPPVAANDSGEGGRGGRNDNGGDGDRLEACPTNGNDTDGDEGGDNPRCENCRFGMEMTCSVPGHRFVHPLIAGCEQWQPWAGTAPGDGDDERQAAQAGAGAGLSNGTADRCEVSYE